MNRAELRAEADRLGVPADALGLDGGHVEEAFVLEDRRSEWAVYYRERGVRAEERMFDSESEACEELLRRLDRVSAEADRVASR